MDHYNQVGMRKILGVYIVCFVFVGNCFGQRQVSPGKNLGNNKVGSFEHVEGVFIAVNGITMYYEEYGEGPALLMLHENGGSVESFNSQINYFSKKYRVIVADGRGQGQTNNTADSLTYELLTEDYNALLEKLDIDSVYVIGVDDGAIVGLMLAMYFPERIKMLAIYGARLNTDSTTVINASTDLVNVYKQMYTDSVKAGKVDYKDPLLLTNLVLHHPEIDEDLLINITAPVLVMGGDRDIIQLEHTVFLFKQLQHAQLSIFPGATHYFMSETPMLFNNAVSKFFSKPFYDPEVEDTIKFK